MSCPTPFNNQPKWHHIRNGNQCTQSVDRIDHPYSEQKLTFAFGNETYSDDLSLVPPSGSLEDGKLGEKGGVRWQHQHLPDQTQQTAEIKPLHYYTSSQIVNLAQITIVHLEDEEAREFCPIVVSEQRAEGEERANERGAARFEHVSEQKRANFSIHHFHLFSQISIFFSPMFHEEVTRFLNRIQWWHL